MFRKLLIVATLGALSFTSSADEAGQRVLDRFGSYAVTRSVDCYTDYYRYKDMQSAAKSCLEAANSGIPSSQYILGNMYLKGEFDGKPNKTKAIKWLKKAATQKYDLDAASAAKSRLSVLEMR